MTFPLFPNHIMTHLTGLPTYVRQISCKSKIQGLPTITASNTTTSYTSTTNTTTGNYGLNWRGTIVSVKEGFLTITCS